MPRLAYPSDRKKPPDPHQHCYAPHMVAAEAAALLEGRYLSEASVRAFKSMKPARQVAVAKRIIALGISADFITLRMLMSTRPTDLNDDGLQTWVQILRGGIL